MVIITLSLCNFHKKLWTFSNNATAVSDNDGSDNKKDIDVDENDNYADEKEEKILMMNKVMITVKKIIMIRRIKMITIYIKYKDDD